MTASLLATRMYRRHKLIHEAREVFRNSRCSAVDQLMSEIASEPIPSALTILDFLLHSPRRIALGFRLPERRLRIGISPLGFRDSALQLIA